MDKGTQKSTEELQEEIRYLKKRLEEADQRVNEINELKEALDENNKFFHTIFNSINDSISILDVETFRIVDMNNAFLRDVRMRRDEVMGKTCYEITHHRDSPCSLPYDFCPLYETVQTRSHISADHIHYTADGEKIFVEISTHPIMNQEGKVTRVVHIARDITERKKLEESLLEKSDQLLELNLNLRKRVEEETEKRLRNEEMMLQQSRMAAMGEMIGAIAHQWRQPLSALGLILQDLEDAFGHGELDGAYMKEAVHNSMEQIKFMSRTIDDFRDFFKPSREATSFDVRKIVQEVLSLVTPQFKSNTIHIHFPEQQGDPLPVFGYKNDFKQVILNILNNARDAIMEKRKKSGKSWGMEDRVTIRLARKEKRLVVRICDTGGGIPEQIIGSIFDSYFSTKGDQGTGVGLYMSRRIVEEKMRGDLTARNNEEGAVFEIRLELYEEAGDESD